MINKTEINSIFLIIGGTCAIFLLRLTYFTPNPQQKIADSADFLLYRRLWRVCLLRVFCIFVADAAKIGLQEDAGQPGADHGLASLSGRINEVPEWCFALAADYSSSSPAIKKMGSVTGAVTTRPTPSAVLPKRVKGASTATAVSMLRG